jgi:phage gp29-like protein
MTATERWRTSHKFGEMTPATLTNILNESGEQGILGRWADFCEYMLETDTHLKGLHETRISRVVGAPQAIVPGTSHDPRADSYAVKAADFCRDIIDGMERWDQYMGWWLGANGRGYAASEASLAPDRNMNALIITEFMFAHPHRFRYGTEWDLRFYDQGTRPGEDGYGEVLRPDKWMVHITPNEGTYAGKAGYLRGCAWPWLYKMWYQKFYAHAVEVNGSPFIYATAPNEMQSDMDTLLAKLENMSYDTVGVFKEGTEVKAMQGATIGDGAVYTNAIDLADRLQTQLILGAEDIVTPGTHGSQSAVDSRIEATLDPRTVADGKRLAADIRKWILEPLCRLNYHLFGYTVPAIPEYVFGGDAKEERMPEVSTKEQMGPETDTDGTQEAEQDAANIDETEKDIGDLSPEEMAAVRQMRRDARPKARPGATPQRLSSKTSQTSKPYQNPIAKALSGE